MPCVITFKSIVPVMKASPRKNILVECPQGDKQDILTFGKK